MLADPICQIDFPATANVSVLESNLDDLDIELGVWTWHNDEYAAVTGTITLPGSPTEGAPWGVFLDLDEEVDQEDDNSCINWDEGVCCSAFTTYDYSFEAPPGTYYPYAFVDNDGDMEALRSCLQVQRRWSFP